MLILKICFTTLTNCRYAILFLRIGFAVFNQASEKMEEQILKIVNVTIQWPIVFRE